MTLTLEVPAEVAEKLTRDAATMGLSVTDYALRLLGVLPPQPPWNGAEVVEYRKANGLLGEYGDMTIDSPVLARQLREQAQRRDRPA